MWDPEEVSVVSITLERAEGCGAEGSLKMGDGSESGGNRKDPMETRW